MSIQSEINRIIGFRDASLQAVAAKGVTVPSGSAIDDLPSLIAQISTGGGSSLNFNVVGGDTRPANPDMNTIFVYTDTLIGSYYVGGTEPTSYANGDVWIVTRSESLTSVFLTPAISINVVDVLQSTSGAWVHKDADFYDGSWQTVIYWLYKEGEEFATITGGWKIVNHTNGRAVKNASNIYLNYTGSDGRRSNAYTNYPVDVTAFSRIVADVERTAGTGDFTLGIASNNTRPGDDSANVATASTRTTAVGRQVIELDVSSFSGSYYLHIGAGVTRGYLYNLWVE